MRFWFSHSQANLTSSNFFTSFPFNNILFILQLEFKQQNYPQNATLLMFDDQSHKKIFKLTIINVDMQSSPRFSFLTIHINKTKQEKKVRREDSFSTKSIDYCYLYISKTINNQINLKLCIKGIRKEERNFLCPIDSA